MKYYSYIYVSYWSRGGVWRCPDQEVFHKIEGADSWTMLRILGNLGWELLTIGKDPFSSLPTYYFKRESNALFLL